MKQAGKVDCARCGHEVSPVSVWPGFVWVKRAWYAGLLVLIAISPIIMSDIYVMMPLALMFAFAAGPIHGFAAQPATCSDCGAELQVARHS